MLTDLPKKVNKRAASGDAALLLQTVNTGGCRTSVLYDFPPLNLAACLRLQYLTFLQNNHIKQPIRDKRREARYFYIPLRQLWA